MLFLVPSTFRFLSKYMQYVYNLSNNTHKRSWKKWNIYCKFEYIGPYFPSSILDQIVVSFSPLLSLSLYLVVFLKMWLRPTSSHSMPRNFADHEFSDTRALYWTSIVPSPVNNTQNSATGFKIGWQGFPHIRIPHSILNHFLDLRFSGWRAQNWASIVLYPTSSTHSYTIYKLTGGLAGCMTQHFTSIFVCPPNNTRSSVIHKLTNRL
jgi:hypothetical protein